MVSHTWNKQIIYSIGYLQPHILCMHSLTRSSFPGEQSLQINSIMYLAAHISLAECIYPLDEGVERATIHKYAHVYTGVRNRIVSRLVPGNIHGRFCQSILRLKMLKSVLSMATIHESRAIIYKRCSMRNGRFDYYTLPFRILIFLFEFCYSCCNVHGLVLMKNYCIQSQRLQWVADNELCGKLIAGIRVKVNGSTVD